MTKYPRSGLNATPETFSVGHQKLIDSDFNISLSTIALYQAFGGGWQTTYSKFWRYCF
jgi:hypothetical protein